MVKAISPSITYQISSSRLCAWSGTAMWQLAQLAADHLASYRRQRQLSAVRGLRQWRSATTVLCPSCHVLRHCHSVEEPIQNRFWRRAKHPFGAHVAQAEIISITLILHGPRLSSTFTFMVILRIPQCMMQGACEHTSMVIVVLNVARRTKFYRKSVATVLPGGLCELCTNEL